MTPAGQKSALSPELTRGDFAGDRMTHRDGTPSSHGSRSKHLAAIASFAAIFVFTNVSSSQDWVVQNSGVSLLLHDIVFVDGLKGWAVGRSGTIIHTTDGGESWSSQVSGTTTILHSVSFVDSLTGWVVGENAPGVTTILHTTNGGNTWTPQGGITGTFLGCHFINQTTGWIVGGRGRIAHTTNGGTSWTVQHSQQDQLLFEIHFLDDSTGYVAGQTGSAPRTALMFSTTNGGVTWNSLGVGGENGLQSVFFTDYLNGWAVGWFGELIHTTDGGSTWVPQESGRTDELLFSVFFNTPTSGWVVGGESGCDLVNCDSLLGEQNIILRTINSGTTWTTFPVNLPNQAHWTKIFFLSPDTGWIVGAGGTILRTNNGTAGSLFPPDQISLVSPLEGAIVVSDSAELRWNRSSPEVDVYWVEYDDDSLFASSVVDSTLIDTVTTLHTLVDGTRYFWKVRAHNSSGWGAFSEARSFTVDIPPGLPPPPVLVSPVDGSEGVPIMVELLWLSLVGVSEDSLRYHVEISEDSLFLTLRQTDSTLTDTTFQVDSLNVATRYYWRVRGKNITGSGPWSTVWDFKTIVPPPDQVSLVSPLEGAVVVSDSAELRWNNAEPEVDLYWVEYDDDSLFTSSTIDSTLIDTVATVLSLLDGTRYFWKVRAHNSSGWGAFSEVRSFTVDIPTTVLPTPSLVSPVDGATSQPTSVLLVWHSVESTETPERTEPRTQQRVASSGRMKIALRQEERLGLEDEPTEFVGEDTINYHIQLSNDSNFSTIVVEDSAFTDTTYQAAPLSFSTQYYWRVKATKENGASAWSAVWAFTTMNPPIPCSELSRLRGRCLGGGSIQVIVILRNTSHTGETMVATIDGTPYTLIVASNGRAQITVGGFGAGTHVVQLVNPAGCFNPLNVSCTGTRVGGEMVEEVVQNVLALDGSDQDLLMDELPATTTLVGIYPNPFNPRVTIHFHLAADAFVDLKIFDLLGREVAGLADEYLSVGKYSMQWDASGQASGVYFCRFHIGNLTQFRKLLLMK